MNQRKKKFLSFYRHYLGIFAADMTCALAVSGAALVMPLLVRRAASVAQEAPHDGSAGTVLFIGGLMAGLIVVSLAAGFYVDYFGHAMGAKMERDMRRELFAHYTKLPFAFYDANRTGQQMSRLTNDTVSMAELFHHGPEDYLIYSVKFIGALVILFGINLKLTLMILAFLPFTLIVSLYYSKKLDRVMQKSRFVIGEINSQAEDTLSGIRTVRASSGGATEAAKFSRHNERFLAGRCDIYRSEAYFYQIMLTFVNLISASVVIAGSMIALGGGIDIPDLIAFIMYISYFTEPVQKLSHLTAQYKEGFAGFRRFMEIMEISAEDNSGDILPDNFSGDIEFSEVSFSYETGEPVLDRVNLKIKKGEFVAIAGVSGVGKSTLCSLIPRFYEPSGGAVYYGGTDISKINRGSLRRHIYSVMQDSYIFSGSIRENIAYSTGIDDPAEIVRAAVLAGAHGFIAGLPDGYDTDVGQRGIRLSGGQRQRIAIARAFLADPPVFIFDEATSALDYESERQIKTSLGLLAENRTMIVIAHRLSAVRGADRIIVLDNGRVAEEGTHEELLARGEIYANIYHLS